MQELEGRVAVVTGGASGIGLALARRFAGEGMRVVIGDVEEPALKGAVDELTEGGADVVGVVTDVTDPDQVEELARAAEQAFGAIHIACNNAGVGAGGLSWEAPLETWQWVIGVNLWGVIHGIRSFVPRIIEQRAGHVVNTASVAGLVAAPFMGPYNASKHAVVALSETLHHELAMMAPHVKVSVLCPAWVNTRIGESERNRPPNLAVERGEQESAMQSGLRCGAHRPVLGAHPRRRRQLDGRRARAGQLRHGRHQPGLQRDLSWRPEQPQQAKSVANMTVKRTRMRP
jgi:NAD(P)-dependent dehydrogenase (short-subunit alcohol dehydrogenase family)